MKVNRIARLVIAMLVLASAAAVGVDAQPRQTAEAAGWSSFRNVSNTTTNSLGPRIAVDSHGAAHVIWAESVSSYNEHIFYSTNASGSWSTPVDLTAWDSHKMIGSIAVDANGNKYVVFSEYGNGGIAIEIRKGTPSGSWTSPQQVSTYGTTSYDPQVAVDGQGGVHVSWSQKDNASLTSEQQRQLNSISATGNYDAYDQLAALGTFYVRYAKSADGLSWGSKETVSATDGKPFIAMAVTTGGVPFVSWTDGSIGNSDVMASSKSNSSWSTPFNVSASGGRSVKPAMAAGSNGEVHVVWNESPAGTYQVYHRSYLNGQWSGISVASSGSVGILDPNVAVIQNGTVGVVWRIQSGIASDLQIWGTTGDGTTWAQPTQITHFSREVYTGGLAAAANTLHIVVQTPEDGDHDVYYALNELAPSGPPRIDQAMGYDGMVPSENSTRAILPAVMWNAYGGWTTGAGIFNTSGTGGTVTITYHNAAGAEVASHSTPLKAHGYLPIYQGDPVEGLSDGFAGSAIVSATVPIKAIVNEIRSDGSSMSYDAPSAGSKMTYLPMVLNNAYGGWTSGFNIANTVAQSGSVTISYRDHNGAEVSRRTVDLNGYAYAGVYQGDSAQGLPDGFSGSAILNSSVPIAVIVNEINGDDAGSMSYRGLDSGSTSVYLPTMVRNGYGGWTTGTGVANTTGKSGSVTISYRDANGAEVASRTTSLNAYGYVDLYQGDPAQGLPDGFTGSAVVSATVPVVAIVNNLNVDGKATSYTGANAAGSAVALPMLEKNGYGGWTSGVNVFNTGTSSSTVTITYYNSDGSVAGSASQDVAAGGHWDIYQGDGGSGLPDGFAGSAVITSRQPVMAIVNEVHS